MGVHGVSLFSCSLYGLFSAFPSGLLRFSAGICAKLPLRHVFMIWSGIGRDQLDNWQLVTDIFLGLRILVFGLGGCKGGDFLFNNGTWWST